VCAIYLGLVQTLLAGDCCIWLPWPSSRAPKLLTKIPVLILLQLHKLG